MRENHAYEFLWCNISKQRKSLGSSAGLLLQQRPPHSPNNREWEKTTHMNSYGVINSKQRRSLGSSSGDTSSTKATSPTQKQWVGDRKLRLWVHYKQGRSLGSSTEDTSSTTASSRTPRLKGFQRPCHSLSPTPSRSRWVTFSNRFPPKPHAEQGGGGGVIVVVVKIVTWQTFFGWLARDCNFKGFVVKEVLITAFTNPCWAPASPSCMKTKRFFGELKLFQTLLTTSTEHCPSQHKFLHSWFLSKQADYM